MAGRSMVGLVWAGPALVAYAVFVVYPFTQTVRYSLYDWDGFGSARFVGIENYRRVLTDPQLAGSIGHAFVLIVFFTVIPVGVGLLCAAALSRVDRGPVGGLARAVLIVPQILPLVGAAIAWTWAYSSEGAINQLLRAVGLGGLARPWLADFDLALPAVGLIGTWVSLGFCTVLLLSGVGRIDKSLFEAARLDGAGHFRELTTVLIPGVRREITVCVTVTVIAALASFDIVYVSTGGGPGTETMVPGVEIYRLTFLSQQVGQASALGVALTVLVLAVVLPLQWLGRER
ncbi:sugar ABC transporter permease [Streptomyces radicis]|uniref:Sugar ABC transporter permease n=1 Tax=Streptomyces radicis TaxID=1750517 RepID=A0A3A9WTK8_9ACTN|nr:sugar ABC transporter permease [Streptomyces radicis]RKN25426.1 sugar ABC transporter permease [Streptomyces radicis]